MKKIINKLLIGLLSASLILGFNIYAPQKVYASGQSWSYGYTGGVQSFTAPYTGNYKIEVWGAQGGGAGGANGGYAEGIKELTAGETLYIYVGQEGLSHVGNDIQLIGSGGGATDIRTQSDGNWRDYLGNRIIVAGGGGGGASENTPNGRYQGGVGGGTNGGDGITNDPWSYSPGQAGLGATQYSGGGYIGYGGQNGSFGVGADADPNDASWTSQSTPSGAFNGGGFGRVESGGGGGGWYGGGAGGSGAAGGGGGGGSGYTGGVSSPSMQSGVHSGNGYAQITSLNIPPNVNVYAPTNNQQFDPGTNMTLSGAINDPDARGTMYVKYNIDGGSAVTASTLTDTSYNQNYSVNVYLPGNISIGNHTLNVWGEDSDGGVSSTQSITFNIKDTIPPNLSISENTTSWSQSVTLQATATDNVSVSRIELPNGNWVYSSSANYTISANGTYTFIAQDGAGNQTSKSITVSNVDTTNPTGGSIWVANQDENGYDVYINGVGDSQSGVNRVQFPTWTGYNGQDDLASNWSANPSVAGQNQGNGVWKFHVSKSDHNNEMGLYYTDVYVVDNAGNIVGIGRVTPTLIWNRDATLTDNTPTTMEAGKTYSITVTAKNTGGYSWTASNNYRLGGTPIGDGREYLDPSAVVNTGDGYSFTFNFTAPTKPGTYNGFYQMLQEGVVWFGQRINKTMTVVDTTAPTLNLVASPTALTNGTVTITANASDSGSGVQSIKLPNGNWVSGETASYAVSSNGTYSFVAQDNAGNTVTQSITVSNIDTTPPTLTLTPNTTTWTTSAITITAVAMDNLSGVQAIQLPNGNWVNGANISYSVSANGTYTFNAKDNVGNIGTQTITISNFDRLPNAPTITSYQDGQSINTNTPTISWVFNDPDNGDYQGWYEVIASNNNWASNYYDSGVVQSGNKSVTLPKLPDGTWQFAVRTWDKTGLWTPPWGYRSNVKVDTVPPVVTSSIAPTNWTNGSVTISVSATDVTSGVEKIETPDGNWDSSSSVQYTVTTNGTYPFIVEDDAGNESTDNVSVTNIDQIAPNTPTINANESWINTSQTVTISDNGDLGGSGVSHTEYSLSGATTQGWTVYGTPLTITNEGQTTISSRVLDNAGNYSSVVSKTVKIDKTNPDASFTSNPTSNGSATITVNATDNLSGVQRIQLPDGDWINGSTVQFTVNANQDLTFEVEDNAGNIATKQYSVTNANKNILITNNRNVTLQLSAQDNLSGVAQMRFKNENLSWSGWEPYTTTKDWFLDPVDGLKHVWVQYMDKAGNISSSAEDVIILDQTAPVISSFTINNGDSYTGSPNVDLQLSATDNLTGVKSLMISNDNVNWTTVPYTTSTPWTLTNSDGTRTVYLKVVDGAGNISAVATANIFLDTAKPVAGILINNGDKYTGSRDVNLTLTFSDSGSGVASVKVIEGTHEYTLPSNATSPTTLPWTLDYGTVRTVTIVVTDKVGNVATASATINVDKLTIQSFTLTNVVYPGRTFTPLTWSFKPQEMLAGADISFALNIKAPYDSSVVNDSVQYKVEITGTNYDKAIVGSIDNSGGDVFTKTVTIPQDAPQGAKIYVSATAQRKLLVAPYDIQTEYFPGSDSSTMAQIGIIQDNISDLIRFNETY